MIPFSNIANLIQHSSILTWLGCTHHQGFGFTHLIIHGIWCLILAFERKITCNRCDGEWHLKKWVPSVHISRQKTSVPCCKDTKCGHWHVLHMQYALCCITFHWYPFPCLLLNKLHRNMCFMRTSNTTMWPSYTVIQDVLLTVAQIFDGPFYWYI